MRENSKLFMGSSLILIMVRIGKVKLTGKIVNRRLNHHLVRVLEPTRKISYEDAERKIKKILGK